MTSNPNDLLTNTFDLDAMIAGITKWVEMESPSDNKDAVNKVADEVIKWFEKLDFTVERIPNLIGEDNTPVGDVVIAKSPWGYHGGGWDDISKHNQGGIIVTGHIDTVHPIGELNTNPVRIEGDKFYGPGLYDMKSGVYMAMTALEHVAKHGTCKLPVTFILVPDEEIGTHSCSDLIKEHAQQNKYTLVFEPARDGGKVVTARRGTGDVWITVNGKSAHAGNALSKGRNAIVEMATHIIPQIKELVHPDEEYGEYSTSIGTINGGTAGNVVPDKCSILVDIRSNSIEKMDMIVETLYALKPSSPDYTIEVTGGANRGPWPDAKNHQDLFNIASEQAKTLGIDLVGMRAGGGSDGNFTANVGCATLDGLGIDGAGAHASDEHGLVSSIIPRTALAVKILENLE